MLFKRVDVFATRILSNKAIIVDGVDVLLVRHRVAETPTRTVFEADAPSFVTERLLNVVSVVDLVVKTAESEVSIARPGTQIVICPAGPAATVLQLPKRTLRAPLQCVMGRRPE